MKRQVDYSTIEDLLYVAEQTRNRARITESSRRANIQILAKAVQLVLEHIELQGEVVRFDHRDRAEDRIERLLAKGS